VIAQWLPVASLNLDLQPSVFLDADKVRRFATAMRRGERFPAITVVSDAGRLFVRDGFHRVAAARACGRAVIDACTSSGSASEVARHFIRRGKAEGLDPAWTQYLERALADRRFARSGVGGRKD
jgi:hypothetical protein